MLTSQGPNLESPNMVQIVFNFGKKEDEGKGTHFIEHLLYAS